MGRGGGAGKEGKDLATSLRWKCHASPEPCYPLRAGNASRVPALHESGRVHV